MRITKTTFLMIFLSIIVINFSTMMSPVVVKSGKNYSLLKIKEIRSVIFDIKSLHINVHLFDINTLDIKMLT